MSNPYYDNSDPGGRFVAGSVARGSDVDAKFDAVQAGFDLARADVVALDGIAEAERLLAEAAAAAATSAATTSTGAATTATGAATTANGFASAALASADAASGSAAAAAGSATTAANSATLSQNWAIKTDGPVSGGEYSAKYWAAEAAAVVTAGAPVVSVAGKTGAVVLVKADVGLSNADNTADPDKPISTATQDALNSKEDRYTETTTAVSKTLSDNEWVTVTAATQTITLPATPTRGHRVRISVGNFADTLLARNGSTIFGVADDYTINKPFVTITAIYDGSTWGIY